MAKWFFISVWGAQWANKGLPFWFSLPVVPVALSCSKTHWGKTLYGNWEEAVVAKLKWREAWVRSMWCLAVLDQNQEHGSALNSQGGLTGTKLMLFDVLFFLFPLLSFASEQPKCLEWTPGHPPREVDLLASYLMQRREAGRATRRRDQEG